MSGVKNIFAPDTIKLKLTSDLWVCSQIAATRSSTDRDPCDAITRTDVQYLLTLGGFLGFFCLLLSEVDLIFATTDSSLNEPALKNNASLFRGKWLSLK